MLDSTSITNTLMSKWDYDQLIFERIIALLNSYLSRHSKCLVVRFDLRFPVCYMQVISNELISQFMQKIIQKYKRQGLDPSYIWVREQDTSVNPHYHCALLLNGHKVRDFHHVFCNAQSLWGSTLGVDAFGLVHNCISREYVHGFKNGIMIETYREDALLNYEAVIHQLSYLAKMRDKRDHGDPWRNLGMSQLH
ncbi:YagK/YfjJ domain-containing protein [Solidesulfovibrio alcoholivorans]|uniref:YagK/YfjJ domain-containing protein n=1 Tax=Solidesulfovibrio alcoholivorans TaxID=81406 RepID=UPI0009FF9192|nr:inovirus-type Gp2 protein [Solidesulfovibrio alcoholivorans]